MPTRERPARPDAQTRSHAEVAAAAGPASRVDGARGPEAGLRDDVADVLEGMEDGFISVDGAWRITRVNAAAERTNGVTRASLLGRTHWEAFPSVVGTDFEWTLRRAMAGREPIETELFFAPDGRWYRMNVHPLGNGGLAFYGRDVTERKEAEEARDRLQRERDALLERLELHFERMPIACFVTDTRRRIVAWNPAAEATFGWRRDEVLGMEGPALLVTPEVRSRTAEIIRRLEQGDMAAHSVNENVTRDGRTLVCEWHNTPLRNAAGAVTGILCMAQDVTERARAEEALRASEERFRGAFQAAAIGFALVETDGRFRAVNRSMCEMLGYGEAELLAMTWRGVTHPDDLESDGLQRARLVAGEIDGFHLDKRYLHKHGNVVWGQLAVSLVRDAAGAPAYTVAQVTDVTARREAEQALARHAADLERSNAELQQFASIVSHDLQEPLRVVASYVQLLAERYQGELDERASRWIGFTVGAVERMQRLIAGLLALAQVRTDGAQLTPTSLAAAVARAWEHLEPRHDGSGARLTHGPLPTLVADSTQLEQLFQNLLGNAIKYRRPGVPPRIHVSAERRAGESGAEWELAVRDNGIGLEVEDAGRIFEIFQRLHRDDEYEGAGIGLAICRKIVERHGGRIRVESLPGQGAAFRFTLAERSA
ncbi:MAG TPA: PAS domain S-box protein [Longimicrobium sp.]|jgi:PAS domain S-box-containing protein|nr:PAS domain S-box protein [Longimicrobium sp.]